MRHYLGGDIIKGGKKGVFLQKKILFYSWISINKISKMGCKTLIKFRVESDKKRVIK